MALFHSLDFTQMCSFLDVCPCFNCAFLFLSVLFTESACSNLVGGVEHAGWVSMGYVRKKRTCLVFWVRQSSSLPGH